MTDSQPLTLEQMRADVAAMISEAPEDIRDDDDLTDLGLDSMRVLALATQWGERGIGLNLSHLAEHVTLGEWWQTIQTLQQPTVQS